MRRRRADKREIKPDPKYDNILIGKFVNMVMERGKKALAEHIVYSALNIIGEKLKDKQPLDVLSMALENTRPLLEVKSRRIGGATYQVPVEVKVDRGRFIAMRWIRDFSRLQKGKSMDEKLADEIMKAYNKEGSSVKKRDDTHKMAEANKAFAHYRW